MIGVPNEDLGEEVKAVVQPVDPARAGPELAQELIAFCRAHLAHFKCPRSVDFVDELPRLPTGKLYKRLVRDQYWAGHQTSDRVAARRTSAEPRSVRRARRRPTYSGGMATSRARPARRPRLPGLTSGRPGPEPPGTAMSRATRPGPRCWARATG